jgi:hypothetical protein
MEVPVSATAPEFPGSVMAIVSLLTSPAKPFRDSKCRPREADRQRAYRAAAAPAFSDASSHGEARDRPAVRPVQTVSRGHSPYYLEKPRFPAGVRCMSDNLREAVSVPAGGGDFGSGPQCRAAVWLRWSSVRSAKVELQDFDLKHARGHDDRRQISAGRAAGEGW